MVVTVGSISLINAVCAQGLTNPGDSLPVIRLENTKNHKQVTLAIGQQVRYQLRTGSAIERIGTIAGASDSTISFVLKDSSHVTIRYSVIKTFLIRKEKDSRTAGTVLMVLGGLGTVFGVALAASDSKEEAITGLGVVVGVVALPMLIGGIALKSDKTLDMVNGWIPIVPK